MSDTPASIHEFDFSLICEYFSALERQGPGSPAVTVQALSFVDRLTAQAHIADVGAQPHRQVCERRALRRIGRPTQSCKDAVRAFNDPIAHPVGVCASTAGIRITAARIGSELGLDVSAQRGMGEHQPLHPFEFLA